MHLYLFRYRLPAVGPIPTTMHLCLSGRSYYPAMSGHLGRPTHHTVFLPLSRWRDHDLATEVLHGLAEGLHPLLEWECGVAP